MSIDQPDARALIEIALKTFREVVLPAVPAEQRFPALMIANALAVAERELRGDPPAEAELASALRALLDEADGEVEGLSRRLCADIRAGDLDGNEDLRAYLWALTRARLAVSNPKYLAGG